jgi:hypothetical protein
MGISIHQAQSVVTAVSEQEAVQPPLELLELPRAGEREAVELRLQARELPSQLAPLAPSARFRPKR